jgi:hypothetical protein
MLTTLTAMMVIMPNRFHPRAKSSSNQVISLTLRKGKQEAVVGWVVEDKKVKLALCIAIYPMKIYPFCKANRSRTYVIFMVI